MPTSSLMLSTTALKKAIDRYYKQLQDYKGRADFELAVRTAFLNLLNETAHQVKWLLIPEQTIEGGIRPDGVLRDAFDLKRGYWEAKGPKSDLDKEITNKIAAGSWRVEKIKLTPDKTAMIVNESLTLEGIPQECFSYRLGNRSALEWVIDQYEVSEDKRSAIVSDPNNLDNEEYIVRLVGRVITVSVDTVRLVNELQQAVKMEDWMGEETEHPVNNITIEEVKYG